MQPTEEQIHDLAWLDSPEGFQWAVDQRPKARPLPTDPKEHAAIVKRLSPLTGGATPPVGRLAMPRLRESDDGLMRLNTLWLWAMPWMHTAYMSDVNAYWHWYQHIRPGFHSWTLAELQEDRAGEMYKICRAIANERKAIRLGKA